jgi:hypothetical protein
MDIHNISTALAEDPYLCDNWLKFYNGLRIGNQMIAHFQQLKVRGTNYELIHGILRAWTATKGKIATVDVLNRLLVEEGFGAAAGTDMNSIYE